MSLRLLLLMTRLLLLGAMNQLQELHQIVLQPAPHILHMTKYLVICYLIQKKLY